MVEYTDEDCRGCHGTGLIETGGGVFNPDKVVPCWWCGGRGKVPVRSWNWQIGPHPDED